MADLVSRKPKADDHSGAPAASETVALKYKPEAETPQPAIKVTEIAEAPRPAEQTEKRVENVSPAPTPDPEPVSDLVATVRPLVGEESEVSGKEPAAAVAPPTPLQAASAPVAVGETPAKIAPKRRNKNEQIPEPAASIGQTDLGAPAAANGPRSILDEMAELDADVAGLRRQLAEKLTKQNAQLRKMLARFDAR